MTQIITPSDIWEKLPARKADSNKGTYGRVLIAAGSLYYRGAALLCTEGALRCGAGLVALASVEEVLSAAVVRTPEVCLLPCTQVSGTIGLDNLEWLPHEAEKSRAVVMGPGLCANAASSALTAALLRVNVPAVVDADALNCHSYIDYELTPRHILTPHPGEMARLTGKTVAEIQADREGTARAFAQEKNCILVLKGNHTLIACPDGTVYENTTGNAGLARGGSGDVLAGMIGALLAQGLSPADAAVCGVWLHGAAADRTAMRLGQAGMLPHDILTDLGALFAENGR